MSNKNRRVVVTGMGALTPIGLTVNEFWNGMMDCKSGAAMIKQFDTAKIETNVDTQTFKSGRPFPGDSDIV